MDAIVNFRFCYFLLLVYIFIDANLVRLNSHFLSVNLFDSLRDL